MEPELPDWARDRFSLRTVELDGEPIEYLVGGTGMPVVMIHGLSASMEWWRFNAPELATRFQVYLIDLPGFGRLGHLDTADSMPEYTEWVCRWMDAVGLERVDLIGHSMGGHISIRLAAQSPERVRRLVLVAPAGRLPETAFPRYIAPVLKMLRQLPGELLSLVLRDAVRRANLRTMVRSGRDLLQHDVTDLLDQVRAPTLLIWGTGDVIVPRTLSDMFTERMPDAELRLVEGASHIPMIDDPDRFNRWIIDFLGD